MATTTTVAATGGRVSLSATQRPEFAVEGITRESALRASELLTANHEKWHIFFNASGFHNHIAHHVLTLFALGATPAELQTAYDDNASYQLATQHPKGDTSADLHDPAQFAERLGKGKHYATFLSFFQDEIAAKGWEDVLQEYLFKGDKRADNMLVRLFAGFLHPIIHLGFGVEFKQPAIVAEALAQTAVHGDWMPFLEWEKAAEAKKGKKGGGRQTIVELLEEVKGDEKVSKAARWEDGNKIRDGLMVRAPEELKSYVSQFAIEDEELEERTAEMVNAAVYFMGAAQNPPHQVKFDFFYMHCVTSSIFFSSFLSQPSLALPTKRRLLEWKVRNDIAMYASRSTPPLSLTEITTYTPRHDTDWSAIFARATSLHDDGHASKLIRALAHGEAACKPFEGRKGFVVRGDMWRRLGHMAIDSVEAGEPHWVRGCGFAQAWEGIPLREGGAEDGARL